MPGSRKVLQSDSKYWRMVCLCRWHPWRHVMWNGLTSGYVARRKAEGDPHLVLRSARRPAPREEDYIYFYYEIDHGIRWLPVLLTKKKVPRWFTREQS